MNTQVPMLDEKVLVPSPLVLEQVESASKLCEDIPHMVEEVIRLSQAESEAYRDLQNAEAHLEDMINAAIVEADFEASMTKSGPLNGIARTSSAYTAAVKKLRADLLKNELFDEAYEAKSAAEAHRIAKVNYEAAKTSLLAMRALSELRGSMLKALSV